MIGEPPIFTLGLSNRPHRVNAGSRQAQIGRLSGRRLTRDSKERSSFVLQAKPVISREDYLLREAQSDGKHEFFQGQIYAMAGGTFRHAQVAGNLYAGLRQALLGGPCQPMNSDMRVHTPSGLDTYPDVSVYCGQPELTDKDTTLLNPSVIIEVLSPSTRDYDRGGKFSHYRSLPGLRDYLLVDPDAVLVEHFHWIRESEWLFHVYTGLSEVIKLESIKVELSLTEIYQQIP